MRILICGINYFPEIISTGKYTREMAEWLVNNGHDVTVITAKPYYPDWKIYEGYSNIFYSKNIENGVTVYRCPIYVPSVPTSYKRVLHLFSFAVSSFPMMLVSMFARNDVLLSIEPPISVAPSVLILSKFSGAKCWLHIQDFEIDAAFNLNMLKNNFLRKVFITFEKFVMSKFDIVSTISSKMITSLHEKGVDENKAVLFENWVDTKNIYPVEAENYYRIKYGIKKDDIVCLYSGNLGKKQGLEIIIDSADKLTNYKKIKFVICGQGSALADLKNKAINLKNVLWLPLQPTENLNTLLNMANIHLLPQLPGAADVVMPSKLTGMLSSGRPVIATAEVGTQIDKIVSECGVVVRPGALDDFVSAILDLAYDKYYRDALGKQARKYAVDFLGYDNILKHFENNLMKLVSA